jgi:hypothetical protein
MDSCQLIRKETKLEVVHLNQKQLAARWSISEATLERWRSEGIGPTFLKLWGRVLYRQVDIEVYEEACLAASTKTVTAQLRCWLRCSISSVDIDKYRRFATWLHWRPSARARFSAH